MACARKIDEEERELRRKQEEEREALRQKQLAEQVDIYVCPFLKLCHYCNCKFCCFKMSGAFFHFFWKTSFFSIRESNSFLATLINADI